MRFMVQRVQEQLVDSDEWLYGDDEFGHDAALELARAFEDGWTTVGVEVQEVSASS